METKSFNQFQIGACLELTLETYIHTGIASVDVRNKAGLFDLREVHETVDLFKTSAESKIVDVSFRPIKFEPIPCLGCYRFGEKVLFTKVEDKIEDCNYRCGNRNCCNSNCERKLPYSGTRYKEIVVKFEKPTLLKANYWHKQSNGNLIHFYNRIAFPSDCQEELNRLYNPKYNNSSKFKLCRSCKKQGTEECNVSHLEYL